MIKICLLADANSIHTRKWVDYFSQNGYDVYIVSMRETEYKYGDNVKIYIVKPISQNKLTYFLNVKKVKNIVREIKPDILHSHYATSYGLYGVMCKYHPLLISVWGSDVYEFPKQLVIKKLLLKFILSKADVVCSTSFDMARETKNYYKKNIEITPFGVDIEKFNIFTPILSNDNITIGVIKNLEKIYGIEYLIKAFYDLLKKDKYKHLKLLIVGEGKEKVNLMNLAKKLGIYDSITFIGEIDNIDVPKYINMMDIVCIPSIMESFGVSAVESCACGRPVIASKVGGLKEVINDGYNGYLVEPQNSDDLAEKLELILGDKDRLMEFSKNARTQAIEKYNWKENTLIIEKIYNKLIYRQLGRKTN